jgi:2-isopropylmalate synthase
LTLSSRATALQIPATYKLNNYVINSGNYHSLHRRRLPYQRRSRTVRLKQRRRTYRRRVQAKRHNGSPLRTRRLPDSSVTEGREAIGEALVKLRDNGKLYSGRGVSTDIIGASVKAYLNALNQNRLRGEASMNLSFSTNGWGYGFKEIIRLARERNSAE